MLYYSKNHLWLKVDGENAEVGLTDYALEKLGGIIFINLPDIGEILTAGERFGDVESVKTVSDLISPVNGEVTCVNEALLDEPEVVSEDPFGTWFIKVQIKGVSDGFMNAEEYDTFKENI